ncbi:MAG: choline-sulfatase [Acidimicrobiales bacterium]|nr:MAG: choline-sulfatase [Acidimicrobiales bacterium]
MNVLLITSDEHNKFIVGHQGAPRAVTPNLDRLAEEGTRFDSAYTNNPICMPARATLATGRYGSAIDCFDNGTAYDGVPASFGHRLRDQDIDTVTFGKLHFMADADSGFDMRLPLQAKRAYFGAIMGWARGNTPPSNALRTNVEAARPGEFEYTTYDRYTAQTAAAWLRENERRSTPWAAHVSFAYPHYPFRVPERYLDPEGPESFDLPLGWDPDNWVDHPALNFRRWSQRFDDPPLDAATLRRQQWIYHGMVTFVDELVGQVLQALDESSQAEDTLVIYTTDHGDMLGEQGMFMKGVFYEGSGGVPMIVRGPGMKAGAICDTPVSLVDIFPTMIDAAGAELDDADADLPGRSLLDIAPEPRDDERLVFAEYHAIGATEANYMLRQGTLKYTEYLNDETPPQLFDLGDDPRETNDLFAERPQEAAHMAAALRTIIEPEEVNDHILRLQGQWLEEAGGVAAIANARTGPKGKLGGYTVPPDEVMAIVGWPDDIDWPS